MYRLLTAIASGGLILSVIIVIACTITACFKFGIWLFSYFPWADTQGWGLLFGLFLWFFFAMTGLSYLWGPVWSKK
jgi:hypothetical protein